VRWEGWFGHGLFLSVLVWIVFGALPTLGLLIGGLFTGMPKDGHLPDGFPAFMPPWWAAYPQTLLLVILTIGSVPLPLRGPRATTRSTLVTVLVFSFSTTLFLAGAAAIPEARAGRVNFFGLDVLVMIQLALWALTVLRMILSAVHLLPRRWRMYLDDDGDVVPPKQIVRTTPRRPWDYFT